MLYSARTDIGMVRHSNQDMYSTLKIADDLVFFLVCDGMGGANGGEEASRLACEVATASIERDLEVVLRDKELDTDKYIPKILAFAAREANLAVFDKAEETPSLSGMGTTFIGAVVYGNTLYAANVGDSRLYIVKDGDAKQITRDHSYVQYLVDIGVMTSSQAETSSKRNIITRAIGTDETVEPDTYTVTLEPGSYILLCSDGLSTMVDRAGLARIVCGEGSVDEKASALVLEANNNGGRDNITVILANSGDAE